MERANGYFPWYLTNGQRILLKQPPANLRRFGENDDGHVQDIIRRPSIYIRNEAHETRRIRIANANAKCSCKNGQDLKKLIKC